MALSAELLGRLAALLGFIMSPAFNASISKLDSAIAMLAAIAKGSAFIALAAIGLLASGGAALAHLLKPWQERQSLGERERGMPPVQPPKGFP